MKKIAILGLTGSIGLSTIEVVRQHQDKFKIVLASAHNNYKKLCSLADEFNIPQIVITDKKVKNKITDFPKNTSIFFSEDKLQELLENSDYDIALNAISGSSGLQSSMTIISHGVDLALANKESLVMAGHLIKSELQRSNSRLIPVDSEHSAILQAISATSMDQVRSIILTASGGPFRELPLSEFNKITKAQTLKHPTWEMGAKITIDSATMMNKGLEVIEAHWLFKKDFKDIKTVIHPQSIIHSLVEFVDGSIIAQMGFPTMKLPILFALSYPEHIQSSVAKTDIYKIPDLSFSEVEKDRFPLFYLACEIGRKGGILPTVLNAANEAAIDLFLNDKIGFIQISKIINYIVNREKNIQFPDLETIVETNNVIYQKVKKDYRNILKRI